MRSDDEVRAALQPLLFGWHHEGIRDTGEAYPIGAFLLVAATVDVLAGLAYNPRNDHDGDMNRRYNRFVREFFPQPYRQLGEDLWKGLRATPLHYLATAQVAFAHSEAARGLHLKRLPKTNDRLLVLHWPQFFKDYEAARDTYWTKVQAGGALMDNARARLDRHQLMAPQELELGLDLPMTLPATFPPPATLII